MESDALGAVDANPIMTAPWKSNQAIEPFAF